MQIFPLANLGFLLNAQNCNLGHKGRDPSYYIFMLYVFILSKTEQKYIKCKIILKVSIDLRDTLYILRKILNYGGESLCVLIRTKIEL